MGELEDAIIYATRKHQDQFDKSGQPYILHPIRVMLKVPFRLKIPALLHDVVEDTDTSLVNINEFFGPDTARIVDLLSRRNGEKYWDYVDRLSKNQDAIIIKMADLEDNMDLNRYIGMDTDHSSLFKRCFKSWYKLKRIALGL